jgi:D-methionine transport system ATP-binding protein
VPIPAEQIVLADKSRLHFTFLPVRREVFYLPKSMSWQKRGDAKNRGECMIQLRGLTKIFQEKGQPQVKALDDISLEIHKGEIFGIIGYSGAGKSTLIRMLNLLEKPTSGSIKINDLDLTNLSTKELRIARRKIGMIFQHFNLLWSRTVFENVAFPLEIAGWPKEKIRNRVDELLALVGLQEKAKFYPSQLSGGQKQRVGIARALANDPEVLLSDEATSALDPKTTDSILELLKKINRELGITIVMITHEMHVIQKICHRVAVIEKGKIVEMGSVLEVFSHPKTNIAKELLNQIIEHDAEWKEAIGTKDGSKKVIKCVFVGETAQTPVISRLIREHQLEVNILQGQINRLQNTSFGTLYLELIGSSAEQEKAIQFLSDQGVEVTTQT